MRLRTLFVPTTLLAALIPSVVQARTSVLVVDAGGSPGSQFTSVAAAVTAAANGDIILVHAGTYSNFLLNTSKDVTIVGDGAVTIGTPFDSSSNLIANIAASARVVLRNLSLRGTSFPPLSLYGASVANCAGAVWFDHCDFLGSAGGIQVSNSPNVVFAHCSATGTNGYWDPLSGAHPCRPAILATNSTIYGYECSFTGGVGGTGTASSTFSAPSFVGGNAIELTDSRFLASRSSISGGPGGDGFISTFGNCFPPEPGGSGVKLSGASSIFRNAGSTILAGPTGAIAGTCSAPPPSNVISIVAGVAIDLLPSPAGFDLPSPQREGQAFNVTITDAPGNSALLLGSISTNDLLLPQYGGALHVGNPFQVFPFGTIPVGGVLSVPAITPNLPPALLGFRYLLQAATCTSGGQCAVSTPSALVILDSTL